MKFLISALVKTIGFKSTFWQVFRIQFKYQIKSSSYTHEHIVCVCVGGGGGGTVDTANVVCIFFNITIGMKIYLHKLTPPPPKKKKKIIRLGLIAFNWKIHT